MFTFQGLIDVTFHVLYSMAVVKSVPAVLSRYAVPCYMDRHFGGVQIFSGNIM